MCSMYQQDLNPEMFVEAYKHPERPVDWDILYEGFDAACDWPTVSFLDPLLKKYSNAKVVLTVRDADSWYKSFKNTIYKLDDKFTGNMDHRKRTLDMERAIVLDGAWTDPERFNDEEAIKAMFTRNIEWVKQNVPKERLLIFELGEGWDRLCRFLNKPVPNEPYPHSNSTQDFNKTINDTICALNPSG